MSEANGQKVEWADVTRSEPCAVCGKPDWCSRSADGVWAICRRSNRGDGQERTDANGNSYWVYRLVEGGPRWEPPRFSLADGGGERADPDALHSALLERLPLTGKYQKALRARGLTGDLRAAGYRTLGRDRARATYGLVEAGLEHLLPRVPGFFVQEGASGSRYWTLSGREGLLIPVRDVRRRIVALLIRSEPDGKGGRYAYLSSKRRHGAGPGAPVHFPLFEGDRATVRVTEGALKADVATALSELLTVGMPGLNGLGQLVPALKELGAQTIRLALDADARRNRNVAEALARLFGRLPGEGFAVELETWDEADGKGIDDLLAAGKCPRVLAGEEAEAEVRWTSQAAHQTDPPPGSRPAAAAPEESRPEIVITTDEHLVNDEAAAALGHAPAIFQRGGLLVRVHRDASPASGGIRRAFAPRIEVLPPPVLRERLSANARWVTLHETQQGTETRPAHPPGWCVSAVYARGNWSAVRHLEAVVDYPVLRPDGTILTQPGYDPGTALLFEPAGESPCTP